MFLSCLLRSELTEGEGRPGRTSKLRGRLVEVFCSYIHTSGQWMSSIYNVYHTYWWTVEVFYILASGVAAMLSYRFKCCTPFPFELISIAKLPLQYTVTQFKILQYLELLYIALFAHLANYSTLQIQFDAKSTLGDSLQPVAYS